MEREGEIVLVVRPQRCVRVVPSRFELWLEEVNFGFLHLFLDL